jgi:predicted Zn-dependent protease
MESVFSAASINNASALNMFANGVDEPTSNYNKGLAQVLKKDWSTGYSTLEELAATGSKNALVFYVQAVAAARQNKTSELGEKLKKAVSLDPSLKAKAVSDLEFLNFYSNTAFKGALE